MDVIIRPYARLAATLFLAMTLLAACKSRQPDLTVLAASPEQITYEVMIESALFSSTRAPTPNEVIAAAEKHCAQYRKKAVFVRVVQRATNIQNITYDCVTPSSK
ncbi:MAG: hypothetical protein AB7T40_03050 [Alphaproteobacteria bacterium]